MADKQDICMIAGANVFVHRSCEQFSNKELIDYG